MIAKSLRPRSTSVIPALSPISTSCKTPAIAPARPPRALPSVIANSAALWTPLEEFDADARTASCSAMCARDNWPSRRCTFELSSFACCRVSTSSAIRAVNSDWRRCASGEPSATGRVLEALADSSCRVSFSRASERRPVSSKRAWERFFSSVYFCCATLAFFCAPSAACAPCSHMEASWSICRSFSRISSLSLAMAVAPPSSPAPPAPGPSSAPTAPPAAATGESAAAVAAADASRATTSSERRTASSLECKAASPDEASSAATPAPLSATAATSCTAASDTANSSATARRTRSCSISASLASNSAALSAEPSPAASTSPRRRSRSESSACRVIWACSMPTVASSRARIPNSRASRRSFVLASSASSAACWHMRSWASSTLSSSMDSCATMDSSRDSRCRFCSSKS
mmetsp:Transcript_119418/g.380868  ORF Transcript_119418/g.380868 Transcript_119418/m.380868 type:complete len:407 (-) Transcript_119418:1316-2536(-)